MKGLKTFEYLNIVPLGSYDVLNGMDWLDAHHAILDCYNKTYNCLDEEGNQVKAEDIIRLISLSQVLVLQLNKCLRRGCQLYEIHVGESKEGKYLELQDIQTYKSLQIHFNNRQECLLRGTLIFLSTLF